MIDFLQQYYKESFYNYYLLISEYLIDQKDPLGKIVFIFHVIEEFVISICIETAGNVDYNFSPNCIQIDLIISHRKLVNMYIEVLIF